MEEYKCIHGEDDEESTYTWKHEKKGRPSVKEEALTLYKKTHMWMLEGTFNSDGFLDIWSFGTYTEKDGKFILLDRHNSITEVTVLGDTIKLERS